MAEDQLPKSISDEMKKLMKRSHMSVNELAEMLRSVIHKIDHRSVETIDTLMK